MTDKEKYEIQLMSIQKLDNRLNLDFSNIRAHMNYCYDLMSKELANELFISIYELEKAQEMLSKNVDQLLNIEMKHRREQKAARCAACKQPYEPDDSHGDHTRCKICGAL